jgi:hypothetical protein
MLTMEGMVQRVDDLLACPGEQLVDGFARVLAAAVH